jgi:hypothetical protein
LEEVNAPSVLKKNRCFRIIILISFILFAFSTCKKKTENPATDPCMGDLQDRGPMIDIRTIVPENGAIDLPTLLSVSWAGGSRHPATTCIYLGKSPNEMKIISCEPTHSNSVNLGELEFNTTYYWKVTIIETTCGRGAATGTLSFTTRKQ